MDLGFIDRFGNTSIEFSGIEGDLTALAAALMHMRTRASVETGELVGAVRGYRNRFPMPDDFTEE